MMDTRSVLIGGVALFVGACAPLLVHSYLERGADLTRYRTYAWATQVELATGDARLDNNPFVDAATRGAVDRALGKKGFEQSAAAPDLRLRYHISIKQKLDIAHNSSYLPCDECTPTLYEAGTLVIDLVDAGTNRLVWRGWGEGSFERLIDDQRALERRIEDVVIRILARLPAAQVL
jgi:hypothetical protein